MKKLRTLNWTKSLRRPGRRPAAVLCAFAFTLMLLSPFARAQAVSVASFSSQLTRVWSEHFPVDNQPSLPASHQEKSNGVGGQPNRPHPAVVRVIVPEAGATSYGSGTLVDARDQFGLVITNWHVVRDAQGVVEVLFPDGFRSKARALKVDADWDLAALVIWRPASVEPVTIATQAPRPGDKLTICGYGQGMYRAATGRCTQYYAPRLDFPRHMVELDVEARQGDSGGPIFNERGELSGVLFGAGQGTTLGSFGGRVESFLATLAPGIGRAADEALVRSECPPESIPAGRPQPDEPRSATIAAVRPKQVAEPADETQPDSQQQIASMWPKASDASLQSDSHPQYAATTDGGHGQLPVAASWFEQIKTVLAAIGVVAVAIQVLRAVK